MDDNLNSRYWVLFQTYGIGRGPLVERTKSRIAELGRLRLRGDAAVFLIANLDYMVIRALSGFVPQDLKQGVEPRPVHLPSEEMWPKIDETIGDIFQRLEGREEVSAHEVMVVVHDLWEPLSSRFAWF